VASAVAEPDIPEKIMLAKMLTWARPPWIWPTMAFDKSTMRSVRRQAFINSPAR